MTDASTVHEQPASEQASAPVRRYHHDFEQARRIMSEGDHIWGWGTPGGQLRALRRERMYVEHTGLRPDSWALEVGCGTGIFTHRISRSTQTNLVAFDLSHGLLQLARQRVGENSRKVHFVVAAAENLPFRKGAFDSAFGSSVLHHLDVDESLGELARVSGPGAKIVFTEPNMLNPQVMAERNIRWVGERLYNTPDETAFIRWPLAKQLARLGFTNIRITPFDFLHPFTPAALVNVMDRFTRFLEGIPLVREISGSLLVVFQTAGASGDTNHPQ